jgi:hypothetical protein
VPKQAAAPAAAVAPLEPPSFVEHVLLVRDSEYEHPEVKVSVGDAVVYDGRYAHDSDVDLSEWLRPGDNRLTLEVIELKSPAPIELRVMASARYHRAGQRETSFDERWKIEGMPFERSFDLDVKEAPPDCAFFEQAEVIDDSPATQAAAREVAKALHAAHARGDDGAVQELTEYARADAARCRHLESKPPVDRNDIKESSWYREDEGALKVEPLSGQPLAVSLVAGGRAYMVGDGDAPLLRGRDGDGRRVSRRVFVGRVDGQWKVVRE